MNNRTPSQFTGMMQDIDSVMHREQMEQLWHDYKWYVAGALGALIIISMSVVGWFEYRDHQRLQAANNFWQGETNGASTVGFDLLRELRAGSTPAEIQVARDWPVWVDDLLEFYGAQRMLAAGNWEVAQSAFAKLDRENTFIQPLVLESLGMAAEGAGELATAAGFYERALRAPQLPPALQNRLQARLSQINSIGN